MSTPRADQDQAFKDKVKILQEIYQALVNYANHLAGKEGTREATGRDEKLDAINEILYRIALVVDKQHRYKGKVINEEEEDKNLQYTDKDGKSLYLSDILSNKIMKELPTGKSKIISGKHSLEASQNTISGDLDKLFGDESLRKVIAQQRKTLDKRRNTADNRVEDAFRKFFDKASFGLFAKVSGRIVTKEIDKQFKLFDKQIKDSEKAVKRQEKEEAKAEAKEKKREEKEEAKKDAKRKKEEKSDAKAAKTYSKGWKK